MFNYKGELKNNVEHGKGVMIYSDDVDSWKNMMETGLMV